jgi:hypothetical protein
MSTVAEQSVHDDRGLRVHDPDRPYDEAAPFIGDLIEAMTSQIPAEEIARLPEDGADNHDHHIYGASRRVP